MLVRQSTSRATPKMAGRASVRLAARLWPDEGSWQCIDQRPRGQAGTHAAAAVALRTMRFHGHGGAHNPMP